MTEGLRKKLARGHARDQRRSEDENVEDIDSDSETVPYRYSITSYGADYPVDGLVKRIDSEDIVIPTFDPEVDVADSVAGFQRQFLWTKPQCDRFIESLLLGLPVPGIFLVKQIDGRLLVLDGQQRLRTLQAYYKGILRGQQFTLENVQERYEGLCYDDLDVKDRRRLDDGIIHATIVRQDEPSDDQSSVYLIFERLNTGGTLLHPQEIRVALFRGAFVKLLRDLNQHESWRKLYGKKSSRLKDQELILRFFALLEEWESYQKPMKEFLNNFLGKHRDLKGTGRTKREDALRSIFEKTADVVLEAIGSGAFRLRSAVNAAVLDSVMVGIALRLKQSGLIKREDLLKSAYERLIKKQAYLNSVESGTASEESVRQRITAAIEIFAKIE
jgi:hypothetical protein